MKIILANTTFLPDRVGGAELHTLWLAQALMRMGHTISVLCGEATGDDSRVVVTRDRVQGVSVMRLKFPKSLGVGRWGIHKAALSWACNFLKRENPDVLVFGLFWDLVGIAEAAWRLEIPYAITAHLYSLFCYNGFLLMPGGEICDGTAEIRKCRVCMKRSWSYRHRAMACLARFIPKRYRAEWESRLPVEAGLDVVNEAFSSGQHFARRASLLVAPTEFVRQELLKNRYDPSKVIVIPYGLPPHISEYATEEGFQRGAPNQGGNAKPIHFSVVSRLSREKGFSTLIRAFRRLHSGASAHLHIYGNGPSDFVDRLTSLAASDPRIRFEGPVEHGRVPRILSDTDVLVIPSEWKEVSGIAAREALALGVPVVASDIGGLPEAVRHGENGILVSPGNSKELTEALKRCIEQRAPRKPLPLDHRGVFTIEENALSVLSACMSLVGKSAA